MDKFRALQYFLAAAEEHSFSGAARRLDVSVPAVAKLVASLEAGLGARLFERTSQGLRLTAEGARYREGCQSALGQIEDVEALLASSHAHGTLVVGAPAFVLQNCVIDAMPRFRARYPDVQLDFRIVSRTTDADAAVADVLLAFGWHDVPDMVQRQVAQTRYHIVAAPAYWERRGLPARPADLVAHSCLCFRNPEGTLLDLWEFERGGEAQAVTVSGWLASSDRDVLLAAAFAGEGIVRITGMTAWQHVRAGRLVPVLEDWRQKHAPPVFVLYRSSQRRSARMRAFVDFITELFRELQAERDGGASGPTDHRPQWQGKRYSKASASAGR